jgi:hypothetical protein
VLLSHASLWASQELLEAKSMVLHLLSHIPHQEKFPGVNRLEEGHLKVLWDNSEFADRAKVGVFVRTKDLGSLTDFLNP